MQNDFTPKFPRSISGGNYRLPLNHHNIEELGQRADAAYMSFPLTDSERGALIKSYDGLKKIRDSFAINYVARTGRQPSIRPPAPWSGSVDEIPDRSEHNAGFIERVRAFIEALEKKYGLSPATPDQASDELL